MPGSRKLTSLQRELVVRRRAVSALRQSLKENWQAVVELFSHAEVSRAELSRLAARHEALKAEIAEGERALWAAKKRVSAEEKRHA